MINHLSTSLTQAGLYWVILDLGHSCMEFNVLGLYYHFSTRPVTPSQSCQHLAFTAMDQS